MSSIETTRLAFDSAEQRLAELQGTPEFEAACRLNIQTDILLKMMAEIIPDDKMVAFNAGSDLSSSARGYESSQADLLDVVQCDIANHVSEYPEASAISKDDFFMLGAIMTRIKVRTAVYITDSEGAKDE